MKSTIWHHMNLAAKAERKAIRGIITRLARCGEIGWSEAALIRAAIRKHVLATSKIEGGLGRK